VCSGGGHHLLIQGAAQISMRDANAMRVAGLDAEMLSQGCGPQQALIAPNAFLTSYYGQLQAGSIDEPVDTVTVRDRHALVEPKSVNTDDAHFRMLQPHEIGKAMAFPDDYTVLGNKRERVKQFGNAVTPPAMDIMTTRHLQSMTGERVA
jgi:DNA (cytosine-5)-methyltransferase 1